MNLSDRLRQMHETFTFNRPEDLENTLPKKTTFINVNDEFTKIILKIMYAEGDYSSPGIE